MGLLGKIFTNRGAGASSSASQPEFKDSDIASDTGATREAHRRELLHVVLRDTMRLHGIPTDWIDARILSGVQPNHQPGLHLQFVVRDGHDRLLTYVFAFQDSFKVELARMEPRFGDWLMSISWEFVEDGRPIRKTEMPRPSTWGMAAAGGLGGDSAYGSGGDQGRRGYEDAEPTAPMPLPEPPTERDDVEDDLAALYAAMRKSSAPAQLDDEPPQPDFEPTRPGDS
jgi:hypothetical protein